MSPKPPLRVLSAALKAALAAASALLLAACAGRPAQAPYRIAVTYDGLCCYAATPCVRMQAPPAAAPQGAQSAGPPPRNARGAADYVTCPPHLMRNG